MKGIKFMSVAVLCLAALTGTAFAQDTAFDLPLTSSTYVKDYDSFKLAANDSSVVVKKSNNAAPEVKKSDFEEPFFTGSNAHKYLGLGVIVGTVLTAATAPGEGCEGAACANTAQQPRQRNGTHAKMARATVALAAATIATGILAHWDDISLEDGITDPDNMHALLGITGAVIMAKAVNKSAASTVPVSHAAMAELGAVLMAIGIKLTW